MNILKLNKKRMLLLSTTSFAGYGLHKIFSFAKQANYDGIELVLNKNQYDFWDVDYVSSLIKEFNVPVLSIKAPKRGMNEKTVDKIVSLANKIGAQNVTFTPPYFRDKNLSWYLQYLKEVKSNNHIAISIENVEPKFFLLVIPEYKDSGLKQIKKITGDTALTLSSIDKTSGEDILKAQRILGASIKNVYFSDTDGIKKGLLPGNAGGGISYLPLESFIMKLKAVSYNGLITLEVTPKELGVGNEEKIFHNLQYFKEYFYKYFK